MDALSMRVASRNFDTIWRGYAPAVVDAYLESVGEQVAKLEDNLRVSRTRIEELERQTRGVRDADTVVKTAFLAAAESKAKLMAEAEEKAAGILADAEMRADRLLRSAAADVTGEKASALLVEAKRELAESEHEAAARRDEKAEREVLVIIEAARTRISSTGGPSQSSSTAAAAELQRIVESLDSLKGSARDGLQPAASLETDIDADATQWVNVTGGDDA